MRAGHGANSGTIYEGDGNQDININGYQVYGPSSYQQHTNFINVDEDGNEIIFDEYPDDMDEYPSELDDFADEDDNVDSDGEPLPSQDEVIQIINAIPSYKFEEAPQSDTRSEASSSRMNNKKENKNGSSMAAAAQSTDSFTARQKKEIKRPNLK